MIILKVAKDVTQLKHLTRSTLYVDYQVRGYLRIILLNYNKINQIKKLESLNCLY